MKSFAGITICFAIVISCVWSTKWVIYAELLLLFQVLNVVRLLGWYLLQFQACVNPFMPVVWWWESRLPCALCVAHASACYWNGCWDNFFLPWLPHIILYMQDTFICCYIYMVDLVCDIWNFFVFNFFFFFKYLICPSTWFFLGKVSVLFSWHKKLPRHE